MDGALLDGHFVIGGGLDMVELLLSTVVLFRMLEKKLLVEKKNCGGCSVGGTIIVSWPGDVLVTG